MWNETQYMKTGHAYLPLCVGGWGDNDPGSQRRLGVREYILDYLL